MSETGGPTVAFVTSSLPRRCGIATFSADVMQALRMADPTLITVIAAIDEPDIVRLYDRSVRWRIRQGDPRSYREAAAAINASRITIVNVQHEFGLYGEWVNGVYEDHLRPFLETLHKPVVTTLHTVPPKPAPSIREAVRTAARLSDQLVVMAHTAVELLASDYGITEHVTLIPHGMPEFGPDRRISAKSTLRLEGRTLISTFGLVDPRKGLEYMIQAMPAVLTRHPRALYLVAGQTHPDLVRRAGEEYRDRLAELVERLGLQRHVGFRNEYLAQHEIVDLLHATDVYVTPYLDAQQVTSGTLAYALGAGKAIVSTGYLHAKEALADGRGILVAFRDPGQLAEAVNSILERRDLKRSLERRAYAYAKDMAWPKTGYRWLELMHDVLDRSTSTRHTAGGDRSRHP